MRQLLLLGLVALVACKTTGPTRPPVVVTPPPIIVPDTPHPPPPVTLTWPNVDGTWLESAVDTSSVNRDAVGDAVVIQKGVLIAKLGNWGGSSGLWSSSVRTWRTLIALQAIHEGRVAREALWQDAGRPFPAGIWLIHVLSRTSNARPPGSSWRYSGGDHWPWQHEIIERMTGESRERQAERLAQAIGARLTWDRDPDDDTQRIDGSPYEMAKLGLLMLRAGQWQDRRIFDADLWAMATGGGVNGDGAPNPYEGWQVHLVKGGMHSDGFRTPQASPMTFLSDGCCFFAAGGTNRGYVFVDRTRELVIARVRRQGVFIDQFLPGLYSALGLL